MFAPSHRTNRTIRLVGAGFFVLVAGLLAGCGSSEPLRGDGEPAPTEPVAPTPSPSSAPTTAEVARIDSLAIWVLQRSNPRTVRFSGADGTELTVRSADGDRSETDGPVVVEHTGSQIEVRAAGRTVQTGTVRVGSSSGAPIRVRTGSIDRRYSGSFHVSHGPDGSDLRIVNRIDLETYVAAVVATEFPFDELEGAKAQAVIARTYALRVQRRNQGEPYDLTDNSASQAYHGLEDVTELTRRAARQTRGEILTYRDRPIEAVYSASSGGHTADNDVVWSTTPVPYLRGKSDPHDQESPHQKWTFRIQADALHGLLSERYGFEVEEIEFLDPGPSGRYESVRLMGSETRTVSANELRLAVVGRYGPRSLKSTLFEVDRQSGAYRFLGHGYGHGVGLSQWGAKGRAEAGQNYREILGFYYTGVALTEMPDAEAAPPRLAAVTDPSGRGAPEGSGNAESNETDGSESSAASEAPSGSHGGETQRSASSASASEEDPPRRRTASGSPVRPRPGW